jgi:transcriptional regulator with XRE-family HTH domain
MSTTIRAGVRYSGVVRWDDVAGRLREVRGRTSQVEFGQALGIPQNVISRYERCEVRPPMEYLVNVARYGKVTLDWLILGERPKSKK